MIIFRKQKTISDAILLFLKNTSYYQRFFLAMNEQLEVTEDHLPAIIGLTKNSDPENMKDQDSANNHYRSFNISFRVFATPSDDLEEIADTLYTDIYNTFGNGNYSSVQQIGNPNMNYLYEDTGTVNAFDLEIPIYYKTSQV